MFEIKIAACPKCGQQYFGDSEEEVMGKYAKHICYNQIPDEELSRRLEAIVNES